MNPENILEDVAKVKIELLSDKKFIKQMKAPQKLTGMTDEEMSKLLDTTLIGECARIYLDELGDMLVKEHKKSLKKGNKKKL